jgi:hypothetical protein
MTNHPTLHKELLEKEEAARNEDLANLSRSKQPTLVQVIEAKKPYDFDHPRSRQIHKTIGEMIAVDSEPFNNVKRTGFRRLMGILEPRYTLPSDKYLSASRDVYHSKGKSNSFAEYHKTCKCDDRPLVFCGTRFLLEPNITLH